MRYGVTGRRDLSFSRHGEPPPVLREGLFQTQGLFQTLGGPGGNLPGHLEGPPAASSPTSGIDLMQATIEKVSNLERRLNVSLPMQEIEDEVQSRLKRMARDIRMHGFRPGKVPFRLVQQTYGGQVRQEVLGDVLQKSFGEAIRQQNLRVAGYPRFEPKPASEGPAPEDNQQVEFSATFEVYPEVSVGDISAVQIDRPVVTVGEAEVDKTVEILRKQRTHYREVEREARTGDSITIDYRGTVGGPGVRGGQRHRPQHDPGRGPAAGRVRGAGPGLACGGIAHI